MEGSDKSWRPRRTTGPSCCTEYRIWHGAVWEFLHHRNQIESTVALRTSPIPLLLQGFVSHARFKYFYQYTPSPKELVCIQLKLIVHKQQSISIKAFTYYFLSFLTICSVSRQHWFQLAPLFFSVLHKGRREGRKEPPFSALKWSLLSTSWSRGTSPSSCYIYTAWLEDYIFLSMPNPTSM